MWFEPHAEMRKQDAHKENPRYTQRETFDFQLVSQENTSRNREGEYEQRLCDRRSEKKMIQKVHKYKGASPNLCD